MHFITKKHLARRTMLQSAGAALTLPFLDAMQPAFAKDADNPHPQRFIGICNNLGLLPDRFFPTTAGKEYQLSPYLTEIQRHKIDFTVFSGVSHPGVDGSHASDVSFLTAAPEPGSGGFRNSVSLDQVIAGEVGIHTRFPSLTLGVNAKAGRRSLSWTDSGVLIPCENIPSEVYKTLFLQGSKKQIDQQVRRLKLGQSIMDTLADESKSLNRKLSSADRDRIEQYTTSVREVERRMVKAQQWERLPKPKPSLPIPDDPTSRSQYMDMTQLMYQMTCIAFETDSTRSITILLDSNNSPTIEVKGNNITDGYHNLSHHGRNKNKLAQLDAIDRSHMKLVGNLLDDLKSYKERDSSLLNNTLVMYGSNFGDANKHTTTNMPVVVAGGRLKHGQHLAFDKKDNYPLPNLYVSMLQSMGIEHDRFASSSGTMTGLDIKS